MSRKIFFTKETCKEEAIKYKDRTAFKVQSGTIYNFAYKHGWLDECCLHMSKKKKPNGYWSKEKCVNEAQKYHTRTEFFEKSQSAYMVASKKGWVDEICLHMREIKKPNGFWTKEKCAGEASKYTTRKEFERGASSACGAARKNKWLDEICSHMKRLQNVKNHWDYETCKKEALKYSTHSEFHKNLGSAYVAASKNGWLNEISEHFKIIGSRKIRAIYAFEFKDRYVYVGLSYNIKRRERAHLSNPNCVVYKHFNQNCQEYKFLQKTDYLDVNQAKIVEQDFIDQYHKDGWKVLNLCKAGAVGGSILMWTKVACAKEALKYKTRSEFKKNSAGAVHAAQINCWMDEICLHMTQFRKPDGYWTKEKCAEEASKYLTKVEFQKKAVSAYRESLNNNWLNEICAHMITLRNPNGYWTKEACHKEALKYQSRVEFQKKSSAACSMAYKKGWIDEICSHMKEIKKPNNYWTKEMCHKEALKYNTKIELRKNSATAYKAAWQNKWLDEICSHMKILSRRVVKLARHKNKK
ncbi:MAG: hypothetical protein K0R25_1079 [Rickettsiaceae bacterium]|jgi:hypothetical protein|nr:hypothetical protein [Rickettsiaceae bacterium]